MSLCKLHNKPKTEIWYEKQHHRNRAQRGVLLRIGCVDCKAAAMGREALHESTRTAAKMAGFTPTRRSF